MVEGKRLLGMQLKMEMGGWRLNGRLGWDEKILDENLRIGWPLGDWCAIVRVDGGVQRSRLVGGLPLSRLFEILVKRFNDEMIDFGFVGRTVEIEGMTDASEDDSMSHLGKEMILEI